ncbi:MAG: FG-GAP-like repeat-containing protein [Phycisphaerae bacterium]
MPQTIESGDGAPARRIAVRVRSGPTGAGGLIGCAPILLLFLLGGCPADEAGDARTKGAPVSADARSDPGDSKEPRARDAIPQPDTSGMEFRVARRIKEARARVVKQPDSAEAWGVFASVLDAHRLFDPAIRSYRQAVSLAPDEFRWAYNLAVALVEGGAEPAATLAAFDAAARLNPDYAPLHWRRGRQLASEGRTSDAAAAFRAALSIEPDLAAAHRDLGLALLAQNDATSAVDHLQRAHKLAPHDAATLGALARVYREIGDNQSADAVASRSASSNERPGLPDPLRAEIDALGISSAACSQRAAALMEAGRYRDAIGDWLIVAEVRPDDPYVQLGLGRAYLFTGAVDKAMLHLKNAINIREDMDAAHAGMGQLYMARHDVAEAIAHFRRAVALAPDEGMARVHLGGALLAQGSYAESARAFEAASGLMTLDAEARCNWGAALAIQGLGDAAIAQYEEAMQANPDHAPAYFGVGYVLQTEGRYQEAIPYLAVAVQIDADYGDALLYLGLCYQKLGRLGDALAVYARALAINPQYPVASAMPSIQAQREQRMLAGIAEPELAQRPMFALIARKLYRSEPKYLGNAQAEQLKKDVASKAHTLPERVTLQADLAKELIEIGQPDDGAAAIEEAIRLVESMPQGQPSPGLFRLRALVYLRQAEVRNCIQRHNQDCCIFPLAGGGVHQEKMPAARAAENYLRYLSAVPDDLGARLLYNIAAMALGDYPDRVIPELLIPPTAFASDYDIKRFADIAPGLGVDTFNLCGGAIVDDFDGDGLLDIVSSTYDPGGRLNFFHNDGEGGFEDRSDASHAADQLGGLNCNSADYDNDGDLDILIVRGAWMYDAGKIRNSLLANDGHGRFTDVTVSAGLAFPAYPTQAAAWADFDNDGDLDLFVGNESRVAFEPGAQGFPCHLLVNQGDGTFVDRARAAGVTNDRYCKGVAAGDYDNDGDVDLYVSNNGPNRLYRNEGNLVFTDVTEATHTAEPAGRSFASWFFDYDNDGWLDLFVGAFDGSISDVAADFLNLPFAAHVPRLYHNNHDGTFTDVAKESGLNHVYLPMGANFGDLDNDGFLDIYLSTGDPSYETLTPNVMLRNDGGKRFQDVTRSGGFGHLQKGHGVAFADIDQDGDQDIFNQLGGFFPGDKFQNALYENPGHGNHFLILELIGTRTNRMAFGARIKVTVDGPDGSHAIHRAIGSVSSFGGSPHRQEIGLGDAARVASVEVFWPVSGTTQRFADVSLDSYFRITEGEDVLKPVAYRPIPFKLRPVARKPASDP